MVRTAGWIGVALALALTLLEFPTVAYDVDHDLSSSASFEYFAARRFQFGTQVLQNVGPLGWLHYGEVYAGYLHEARLVLKGALRLALAALVLWACTRFPTRSVRAGWLLAFFTLLPIGVDSLPGDVLGTYEVWAYVGLYLAALVAREGPWTRVAPALLYLAALSLMKHPFLALATFSVLVDLLDRLRSGAHLRAAVLPMLVFAGAVALLWTLAGQDLTGLPHYAFGAILFAAGYNEALGLPATPLVTGLAVAAFAGLAALIALRAVGSSQSAGKSFVDAAFLFVIWKHAIVRADATHVAIFFTGSVFLALLFGLASESPGPPDSVARGPSGIRWRLLVVAGVVGLCAPGLFAAFPEASYRPGRLTALWARNLSWLVAPGRQTAELAAALRENERRYDLPWVRERVGRAPIDFFGYEPGWLLLNGLNYTPRPMPISFAAANGLLLRRNEAFYRDPRRAPHFVLAKLGSIDDRLVTQDDGLALGALLDNYHPVLLTGDLVLLERNPAERTRRRETRRLLLEREIAPGEALSLQGLEDRWLWLEADVRSTPLGWLRALVLRPPVLRIALDFDGGRSQGRRYVASMGGTGFLISPFLERTTDLFGAFASQSGSSGGGAALPAVRAVRFLVDPGDLRYLESRIATRVHAGPRPRGTVTPASPTGR